MLSACKCMWSACEVHVTCMQHVCLYTEFTQIHTCNMHGKHPKSMHVKQGHSMENCFFGLWWEVYRSLKSLWNPLFKINIQLMFKKNWLQFYFLVLLVLQCWRLKTQSPLKYGFYEMHLLYCFSFLYPNTCIYILNHMKQLKLENHYTLTIDTEFMIQF